MKTSCWRTRTTPRRIFSPRYYFTDRDAFRTPDITSTNLAVNYRYPITRFELFAQGELLNAFDEENFTVPNVTVCPPAPGFGPGLFFALRSRTRALPSTSRTTRRSTPPAKSWQWSSSGSTRSATPRASAALQNTIDVV